MSKKTITARCVGAAAVLTGALALVLPGTAAAGPAGDVPAPKVSAQVNDGAIEMTLTHPSGAENLLCMPMVLAAEDALPLATMPTDEWPSFIEMINVPYYLGNPTMSGVPTSESTTALDEHDENTGLLKEITPGAYAVVGVCFDAATQDSVESYSYQVVFFPGGTGSLGQALDLGSTTLSLDGGLGLVADLLMSGAGSSMLSANLS